jgi:hypothetical protein
VNEDYMGSVWMLQYSPQTSLKGFSVKEQIRNTRFVGYAVCIATNSVLPLYVKTDIYI